MSLMPKLAFVFYFIFFALTVSASPIQTKTSRSRDFQIPEILQGRVNFWIDVFTKHGKNQAVVHHRNFPQAIFTVMDFRVQAESLNPVQLERFKDRALKAKIREIEAALSRLASGQPAQSELEKKVYSAMKLVPGGPGKYKQAVKEGLVRSQTGIREKYGEAVRRSGRYLHAIEKIFVQDYGLPVELTRLPFIESSFDYQAYSSVGAAGIWQFMPLTGRKYMTVNRLIDERRDVLAASKGAARYLQSAYSALGNWPLAITSYNHGVAGVSRKVRQMGTSNLAKIIEDPNTRAFGFASSNFYPEFLAALEVYDHKHTYFPDIQLEAPRHFVEVSLPRATSVAHISKQLEIGMDELRSYNYAISETIWQGRSAIPAGYTLKLPASASSKVYALRIPEARVVQVAPPASSVYGGTVYRVRSGDTLSSIAKKFKITLSELKSINGLSSNNLRIGQALQVKGGGGDIPTRKTPEVISARHYTVKPGDSLWSISRKFKIDVNKLRDSNKVSKGIRPGQILNIP